MNENGVVVPEWTGMEPVRMDPELVEQRRKAADYRDRRAVREQALGPAANDARRRYLDARADAARARDMLGRVAGGLLIGESTEDDLIEVRREVQVAEDQQAVWMAALQYLDDERGAIREPGFYRDLARA